MPFRVSLLSRFGGSALVFLLCSWWSRGEHLVYSPGLHFWGGSLVASTRACQYTFFLPSSSLQLRQVANFPPCSFDINLHHLQEPTPCGWCSSWISRINVAVVNISLLVLVRVAVGIVCSAFTSSRLSEAASLGLSNQIQRAQRNSSKCFCLIPFIEN